MSTSDAEYQKEEQIGILLDQEIKPLGTDLSVEIEEENRLDRVLHLLLIVSGKSAPELDEHTEEYRVEIRLNYATCDMCGMMSGGYYEATLQIRADDRSLTEDEQDRIVAVARERTIAEYGKDNRAFILQIDETKFGLDLFIGSELLCRRIADEIEGLFLAERKENYKLVTQERGGKRKYRITILLRLPRYALGDFIKVLGNPCQVVNLGKGGVACYDLVEKQQFTVTMKSSKWRTIEFLAEAGSKRAFSIVSNVYGQPIQVMDSETFEMVDIDDDSIREINQGDTIYLLRVEDLWYYVPELEN